MKTIKQGNGRDARKGPLEEVTHELRPTCPEGDCGDPRKEQSRRRAQHKQRPWGEKELVLLKEQKGQLVS